MREKKFQELTFADDYMFCRILQKHMDVAKQIVKLATGREVENIAYSSKQYAIDPYVSAKSIRFDIYFVGDNEVYDIEMQTTKQKDIVKRTRYYLGLNDVEILKQGEDYENLPRSYIIFICKFDPFGQEYEEYVSEERLFGISKEKVDITEAANFSADYQKVFLNAGKLIANSDNPELANFLNYVYSGEANDEFTHELSNYVQETKQSAEEARMFMTYQEHLKDSYIEGKNDGVKENATEVAKQMLIDGEPMCRIVRYSKLSEEEIQKLKEELSNQSSSEAKETVR